MTAEVFVKLIRGLMPGATVLAICMTFQSCVRAGGMPEGPANPDSPTIPTVTYCDLVRHPELYNQKKVRLRAVFTYGFERSFLGDVACDPSKPPKVEDASGGGEIWMDLGPYFVAKPDSEETWKKLGEYGLKDLTAIGIFQVATPPERYGHLGSCRFQFVMEHVEHITWIRQQH
jgi:hypothetical protein